MRDFMFGLAGAGFGIGFIGFWVTDYHTAAAGFLVSSVGFMLAINIPRKGKDK